MMECLFWSKFDLTYETIHFVDDEAWFDTFFPCLAQNGLRLDADAFDSIDDDERAVTEPYGCGDI